MNENRVEASKIIENSAPSLRMQFLDFSQADTKALN